MKATKSTAYTRHELDELYELTDSWTDISKTMADGRDVDFVVDRLEVLYRLPARTARAVGRLAQRRRTTPERLIERWVNEKLAQAGATV